jgi:hypothetical protein
VLRFCVTLRFVAAAGRHELLGGGVVGGGAEGGGVGVGAVGAGLAFSPLAQAPASKASSTIDRSPTRITDTLLTRTGATVVPGQDCEAKCNSVELRLTISTATDQFCGSILPLPWCAVVVSTEFFFGVLDVLCVGPHHVLGERDGTAVPVAFIRVRVAPCVCFDGALPKVLIDSPVRAWVHVSLPSEVAAASTGSGTSPTLHPVLRPDPVSFS